MQTLSSRISGLYAGGTGRLEPEGQLSGIFKRPVTGGIAVSTLGLAGDEHCDHRVHGGPEKAVHQYAQENYRRLAKRFPQIADDLVSGSLGENISASGMSEKNVHLGDVFKVGTAVLEVSQPRSPCWKINHRFGVEQMSMYIAQERLTGWYYRVLQPGFIEVGNEITLVERRTDRFSIDQFWNIQLGHRPFLDELHNLAETPGLSDGWKKRLRDRVEWLRKQQS